MLECALRGDGWAFHVLEVVYDGISGFVSLRVYLVPGRLGTCA